MTTKTGKTVAIPSKPYERYEKAALWCLPKGVAIDYPVNVKAIYYMDTHRIVDITGLHQALHDILVKGGVLKDDNSRIVASTDGSRVRYDKDNPRTEIEITEAESD